MSKQLEETQIISNKFEEQLEGFRTEYGISAAEISGAEVMEYLKYVEIAQLKEQNGHLKDIKAVVAWMSSIALLFIAIGFLICLVTFAPTNGFIAFASFVLMMVFFVLAAGMFQYRK